LGNRDDLTRYLREEREFRVPQGHPMDLAAIDYELSLLRLPRSQCASMEPILSTLPEAERQEARRMLLLVAASYGCAPCTELLRYGMPVKMNIEIFRYATCALKIGRNVDFIDAATKQPNLGSPYEWVLSRYQLAQALELAGQRERARGYYQTFLDHWGKADQPPPEVEEARSALRRLQ
jgi:hypothetical protein